MGLTRCIGCSTGPWGRYGLAPPCQTCAVTVLGAHTPEDVRALLHGLLPIWKEMDESRWRAAEVGSLKDSSMGFWSVYPTLAEGQFLEGRQANPIVRR